MHANRISEGNTSGRRRNSPGAPLRSKNTWKPKEKIREKKGTDTGRQHIEKGSSGNFQGKDGAKIDNRKKADGHD